MRAVFLTSRFLPHSMGGGETHTFHLARTLARRGHDVEILLAGDPPNAGMPGYDFEDLKVTYCPADADTRFHSSYPAARAWLQRCHAKRRIDVIHVMVSGDCKGMMSAAVELEIPLVVTLLDFHYWCPTALLRANQHMCSGPESIEGCHRCALTRFPRLGKLQPAWSRLPVPLRRALLAAGPAALEPLESIWQDFVGRDALFRKTLAPNATFVAPSPIMRRLAEENGVLPERVLDMPYGVPDSFVGTGRPKTVGTELRAGYLGRLVHEKGVHVLIEAVRRLPTDVKLHLVLYGSSSPGPSDYLHHVHALADGDPRIEFRPVIPQHEIARAHRELDLIVIPSLWHENATITLLESLALGTPAIVSNVEGMALFIENGKNGFTVPVGDAAALSEKLAWCARHPQVMAGIAAACRPIVTIERQAQDIEAVYVSLIHRSQPASMRSPPQQVATP